MIQSKQRGDLHFQSCDVISKMVISLLNIYQSLLMLRLVSVSKVALRHQRIVLRHQTIGDVLYKQQQRDSVWLY